MLCCFAKSHYDECRILFIVMLNDTMLSVVMLNVGASRILFVLILNVVMLNAILPSIIAPVYALDHFEIG